jgi:hypothetical protein
MQGNPRVRRCTFVGAWCAALPVALGVWAPSTARANSTHTGHQFAVTEGGAATINIPIQVPRGIGGLEPQLSLNYSSGGGNGLLGVGWTLSGPSAITRCGKTLPLDNQRGTVTFAGSDRFCLDGQRLVSDVATNDSNYGNANTVYWTERESFSRITATGAYAAGVPSGFKVETKSGLIMEFGAITGLSGSSDAQALTNPIAGGTTTINRWMLKRISDRMPVPNTVEFYYCAREVVGAACATTGAYTGSNVLHYIRYTNRGSTPGTNAVVFGYESRDDRLLKFQSGTSQVQTQRMASITTYVGFASPASLGEAVKRYELTYEPLKDSAGLWTRATNVSRLSRVQELRGGAAPTSPAFATRSADDALPPVDFIYATDRVYGKALAQTTTGGGTSPPPVERCGGYAGANRVAQMCK